MSEEQLIEACKTGNLAFVKSNLGLNFNYISQTRKFHFLMECLFQACSNINVDVVELLVSVIKKLFDKKTQLYCWNYGLYASCLSGSMGLIKLMIEYEANDWNNAIYWACKGNNQYIIDFVISQGTRHWNNGLYGACEAGNLELVKFMIKKGANDLNTGFEKACREGHQEVVEFLIDKTTDLGMGFAEACVGGHMNIVKLLLKIIYNHPKREDILIYGFANAANNMNLLKFLIPIMRETKAGRENKPAVWQSVMIEGIREGNFELIELMIANGANDFGLGLFEACRVGHIESAELMLKYMKTSEDKNNKDWLKAARKVAMQNHHDHIIELLAHE